MKGISPTFAEVDSEPKKLVPGGGRLEVEKVDGRSTVTGMIAQSPLRLLSPRRRDGESAWVYASTFGGGILAGDCIDLHVRAGSGSTLFLGTQASTKVFRSPAKFAARQVLDLTVAEQAICCVLPDPLTCFADAVYEQRTTINLATSASLVFLDWFSSGRRARGERWAMRKYQSQTQLSVGSCAIYRDAILLNEADGPIGGEHRMGRCDCYATLVVIGPAVEMAAANLLSWIAAQPVRSAENLIFSASPLPGGAVLRVAGSATEQVGRWLGERLSFVPKLLGEDPWSRKW